MVFCTYCGHSFTRDEHLERHILTHTNVKPFKCFTCHMSFARRDLLQRHYTVHGRNQNQQEIPAANGMMPKSAGRTPIACSNCAKTKTKCDKKFPCSRCAGRNLKCTLRPTRRSTKNAARMGLITAETLAQDVANGTLPPDQTIAAENVPMSVETDATPDSVSQEIPSPKKETTIKHHSLSSTPRSASVSTDVDSDTQSASILDQSTGCPTPPVAEDRSPTTPITAGTFPASTPFHNFDDFSMGKGSVESSPHFMLDWQQLQLPLGFDPAIRNDSITSQDLNFDMSNMGLGAGLDLQFSINPELTPSMSAPLLTPIETPVLNRTYSDADLPSLISHHSHRHSMVSNQSFDSFQNMPFNQHVHVGDPVVAAQDGWNAFRCVPGPRPLSCPTTARWNLETLENSLKSHEVWNVWSPEVDDSSFSSVDRIGVMQIHASTRDKLLAITQGFLHKALEIHRGSHFGVHTPPYTPTNFVLLPPAKVLEYFLHSYGSSFESYYPVTSRGTLDANELVHCFHDKASSLLILLMLASGARNIPSAETRSLTAGLVETCRISLFDLVEKDVQMASDPNVLHAALLFTELAAWSGDKWHMDIAMGQRGIYTSMLRHSGLLEALPSQQPLLADNLADTDRAWNIWMQRESRSRLVYSWALIDQELALFHDSAPLFSVTEFGIALPHSDNLWRARSAGEWLSMTNEIQGITGRNENGLDVQPPCLTELFRKFLDETDSLDYPLTALHIRLLLHPLQSMLCHYSQLMSCFTDSGSSRAKNKTVTASSTRCRVEEVQCLLQRWYKLADAYAKSNPSCPVIQASLVLYHLISLNAVTDFKQIERLARRETFDGTYQSLVWVHKQCLMDVGEAVFHCGQVLRLVRSMPRSSRPSWWAAAIYRAGLVLWCDSLINKDGPYGSKPGQLLSIDSLTPDHPSILRYLNKGEGIPCLSKKDGSTVTIDHGLPVLNHCIEILDEGASTQFQEGIRNKLDRLMRS